ncbi:MAG: ATP-grasp domain-containing protein, partial [Candidatus Omnitrophica bacterium]|nr:ATP-grasp domain-containing protein [Candidatus Omnitrophota bacterium]
MPSQKIFLPPSTLGMLGGGQLGRMFALAAKQMGYRVITLDKTPHSPMGQVCDEQIVGDLDDPDALERLGDKSNILTYEFEHIDVGCVEMLEEKGKIVRPSSNVLKITQHRLFEKEFIVHAGLRVADYAKVESNTEFDAACAKIGFPAVLKTVHGGYDGKGQCIVRDKSQALKVFNAMKRHPLVWEKKIPFLKELSIIAARDAEGNVVVYPVSENMHIDNILDTAIVPA